MTESAKLAVCLVMSAVGLVLAVDIYRITHIPQQPGRRVGKHVGPVQSPARAT